MTRRYQVSLAWLAAGQDQARRNLLSGWDPLSRLPGGYQLEDAVSRMRVVYALVWMLLLPLPGHSALPVAAALPPPPAESKIAPWVMEHTANGAQAEFRVVMAEQADLAGAGRLPTKLEGCC
jgi:hypothetical protein